MYNRTTYTQMRILYEDLYRIPPAIYKMYVVQSYIWDRASLGARSLQQRIQKNKLAGL